MIDIAAQKQQRISLASANQRQAADPLCSVWVEASAGTGKTKVLSDRVLRLLLDGTDPSRILCLTYTKAAAVEMNNRIAERLSIWAVADDDKLRSELEKLLGLNLAEYKQKSALLAQARRLFAILLDTPGGIKIQTIHSFCQEILKRFPLEAKISPYFEIMDDRAAKEALETIKSEILQGNIGPRAAAALSWLTAATSEFKFPEIMRSISDNRNLIEDYLRKYGSLENLIEQISSSVGISLSATEDDIKQDFWQNSASADFSLLIKALASGNDNSLKKSIVLDTAVSSKDFDGLCSLLLTNQKQPRERFIQKSSLELYPGADASFRNITANLLSALDKLAALRLLRSTEAVLTLSEELLARYRAYKKLHSKMDYNDLIILTKHLLESPSVAEWILYKLDGGLDHILIDEAQDTSPEQWSIIKSLTKEFFSGLGSKEKPSTIFVVGDRKQSIYSFQGADPKEFENMHRYFRQLSPDFKDINMEVSFRSTSAVLDAVNTVFASPSARQGVALPQQNIFHIPSRIGDAGRVEIWPLVEPDIDDTSAQLWRPPVERVSGLSSSAKLARQIAETIHTKVCNQEILKSQGRPLKYRDFLILVQRRNSFVEEIVRACKTVGVNIAGVDKIKLSEQIAVNDLLALAQFTLLPSDDLNLACVLKSPLFGLNDDDLFTLCYNRGQASVWQRVQTNPSFSSTAQSLQQILNLAAHSRPFEFFSHILGRFHGRQKFIQRLGLECEDALDEFINLSLSFEQDHIPSMQLFVEWMNQDDVEIKRELEQNNLDAVRLMTVHGSKGLQAPIVILPDTVRVKTIKQEAGWLYNKEALFYPLGKDYYENNCSTLKEEQRTLSLEEYHRLLYVALTRAEECLCICGYKQKKQPSSESWYELCRQSLASIMQTSPNDILFYQTEQLTPTSAKPDLPTNKVNASVPKWLLSDAIKEAPLARPLTPSHLDESGISAISPLTATNDNMLYNRGRIIHKLLQLLPSSDVASHVSVITQFLHTQAPELSSASCNQIISEVINLIEDPRFKELFGPQSAAEVSIMGEVDGQIISGQIDRLVVLADQVIIVDYKTNRPAAQNLAEVPTAYLKQIRAYRCLAGRIYPHKKITSYILWTNTATMMQIE